MAECRKNRSGGRLVVGGGGGRGVGISKQSRRGAIRCYSQPGVCRHVLSENLKP